MNGQSAPHTPSPPPPSPPGGFFHSVRRLGIWRTPDRWAGGVAAGVARRYGLDPLLVRGIFVVVTLFGGLGLVLYGLAWALLPEASDGRIHLEQAVRGDFDIALAGAAAVLIVGLSRPVFWWDASWWSIPWVVAIGGVIAGVLISRDRGTTRSAPAPFVAGPVHDQPAGPVPDQPPHAAAAAAPRPAYDVPEDTVTQPADPATDDTDVLPQESRPQHTEVLAPSTMPLNADASASTTASTDWDAASAPHTTRTWGPAPDDHGSGGGRGDGTGWHGAPTPPTPPPPPVPGPGSRTTNLVLAVSLLGAAGIALAHHQGVLDANPWLVGGGAVLAVLGAGVLVSGMRGRSQGGIGVLALLLAIVMVPAAAAAAALPGFARLGSDATMWAGDPTWAPTTTAEAEDGYSLVAGNLVVDLSGLEADSDLTVPASVVFGNLTVVVPDDADVTINADVGAGEVVGQLGEDWTGPSLPPWGSTRTGDSLTNGVGIGTTLTREGDGSGPQITIDAEVSFGQIYIEETS